MSFDDYFDSVSPDNDAPPEAPLPPLRLECTPPPFVLEQLCKGFANRHKRLMVAAWALTPAAERAPVETFRRIWRCYELTTGLIDRPGRLTTASILQEVAALVS